MSNNIRVRIANPNEFVELRRQGWLPMIVTITISLLILFAIEGATLRVMELRGMHFRYTKALYIIVGIGALLFSLIKFSKWSRFSSGAIITLTPAEIIGKNGAWRLPWDRVDEIKWGPGFMRLFVHGRDVDGNSVTYSQSGPFSLLGSEVASLLEMRRLAYLADKGIANTIPHTNSQASDTESRQIFYAGHDGEYPVVLDDEGISFHEFSRKALHLAWKNIQSAQIIKRNVAYGDFPYDVKYRSFFTPRHGAIFAWEVFLEMKPFERVIDSSQEQPAITDYGYEAVGTIQVCVTHYDTEMRQSLLDAVNSHIARIHADEPWGSVHS